MQGQPGPESHPLGFVGNLLIYATVLAAPAGVVIRWKVLNAKTPPKFIEREDIFSSFYAGSTIPIGLLLLWCSVDRRFIVYLNDLHLTLAAAGIATLWVAYKGLKA